MEPHLDLFSTSDGFQVLKFDLTLRFRINQKYLTYPKRKYIQGADWPEFWVNYQKGKSIIGSSTDYDRLTFNIKDDITLGLFGFTSYNFEAGGFINNNSLSFIDYKHFNGNRFFIADPSKYYTSFLLLPYYDSSTPTNWAQVHFEHHFEGFFMDKIPLLRKLNIKTVLNASFLYTKENKDYFEVALGFENLGFGALRIFRLDVVNNFYRGRHGETRLVLGINL